MGGAVRYPKLVRCAKTPIHITIQAEDINEFGERETILDADFLCNWQDKSQVKYTSKDTAVTVSGSAFLDGDIQEDVGNLTGGTVEIFDETRNIYAVSKCRNLDGTVNYTRVDVL